MMNSGKMTIVTQGDRAILVTRAFDAPRRLVWEAMTKPELLKRWMTGPPGWSFAVCEVDLRVGGKYRYVWHGPGGEVMGMGGVHREIVAPERLVCTQLFDQDWTGGEALGTLVLVERDGRTTISNTIRYSSQAARAAVLQTPMEQGMAASYDQLEMVLAKEKEQN
jgi:uncharacterized protein YndB with AHSA1/START domain